MGYKRKEYAIKYRRALTLPMLFGFNPSIPSLCNPYESPAVLEDETPSQKVAANIKAIYSARKNQMAIDAEAKVRRALRSKTRDVYSEIVETGDFVYYKRDGSKRWRGPATVTGRDGKIIILRHGGYPAC